ncbi:MAG TPA: heavy metal-binding domain-containing protein [Patescibacteria group bacterium]|nr:heavy metal-binding domain-containing protein [Patescibacteria group bacterium]
MAYTCPMHPEVLSDHFGRCPTCGMKLVKQTDIVRVGVRDPKEVTYLPLLVVVFMIVLITFVLGLHDVMMGSFLFTRVISYFMIGFFLVFSTFKLIDLKGFAKGYATYDLLAMRWEGYGYIYPFLELFFGIGMIYAPQAKVLLIAEIIIMVFSGLGVTSKLLRHEKFTCACLGTFLKVPLTKITLVEDFGMAALALLLLLLH